MLYVMVYEACVNCFTRAFPYPCFVLIFTEWISYYGPSYVFFLLVYMNLFQFGLCSLDVYLGIFSPVCMA